MKQWIVGNWKMNGSSDMIAEYIPEFLDGLLESGEVASRAKVALCPPFPYLSNLNDQLTAYPVRVGAQNVSHHSNGYYTGEVSAEMLAELGITLCLVGHSERRRDHHEDNALVGEKLRKLLEHKITPIACVGETLEEREAENHHDVVKDQLNGALDGLTPEAGQGVVIAYEPVWAIGTGLTATPEQARGMHEHIRELLTGQFGEETATTIPILYGGSVNAENAHDLLSQKEVNGALIGSSSLKPDGLLSIIKQTTA